MKMVLRPQSGVALMTAIVLVALAAILAVGIATTSALSARRGAAVFGVEQSLLIAEAAEAYASDVLTQDNRQQDYTAEKWAQPIPATEVAPGISVQAELEDLAGRFNLNSLVDNTGKVDEQAVEQFRYLLDYAKLESYWADKLVDWIDTEDSQYGQGGEDSLYTAQAPPYLAANLAITSISELMQLPAFGAERYARLAPLVTALPTGTLLNLCTAKAEVLDAFVSGIAKVDTRQFQNDPQLTETQRKTRCFPTKTDMKNTLSAPQQQIIDLRSSEKSDYFRLQSIVSIGTTRFALYSLLLRENGTVRPVLRTYGTD
jgi:general secretion pathway protein K